MSLSLADYKAKCAELLKTAANPAESSEILTQLSDTFSQTTAELELAKAKAENMEKANAALVKENMRLFLSLPAGEKSDDGGMETEKKKPSFSDLFDPKTHKLKEI